MWKGEWLMCVFQGGSGFKEGVGEKSEERLKRCMNGLMLFLRLSCEGKVCCSCNLPINCFHCLRFTSSRWEMPNNRNIFS